MADWRQIQARIRKAKSSPDAAAKLNELYQRTRDGMVAWELALIEEKAERIEEAGRWYAHAAQRFRRADWRKKAEEALTRLGMEIPARLTPSEQADRAAVESAADADAHAETQEESESQAGDDSEEPSTGNMPLAAGEIPESQAEGTTPAGEGSAAGKRKRRRGRRGGRGRRRRGTGAPGLPTQAYAPSTEPQPGRPAAPAAERPVETAPAPYERASRAELPAPQLPSERSAHGHGRGEPALASRMAHLESLLRRLVQSPLHRLDECDDAPAGPGVILLSDSDQVTSYYIEACQTLRIGAANLVRGGRSAKGSRGGRGFSGDAGLKPRLAEYLGINEAKVSQYMKDHCVLRWIQLDEDAPMLAHFAIGVLRTPLNLD